MIYFFVYLFLETVVSVEISSLIGGIWTFIEIVVSAFIGFILLTETKYNFAEAFLLLIGQKIDINEFVNSTLGSVLGAILLIIPGFLTDILGLLLYFGIFSSLKLLSFTRKSKDKDINTKEGEYDVIDVEVIEHHNDRK